MRKIRIFQFSMNMKAIINLIEGIFSVYRKRKRSGEDKAEFGGFAAGFNHYQG